jgi:adenosylmethionine-8-amino-7-oxononanoate aminotransferase
MLGIDQVEDKTTKAPIIGNVSERIFKFCIDRGVIVRPVGSRIIISPPLIFSSRDCDTLISALNESIMAFVANR